MISIGFSSKRFVLDEALEDLAHLEAEVEPIHISIPSSQHHYDYSHNDDRMIANTSHSPEHAPAEYDDFKAVPTPTAFTRKAGTILFRCVSLLIFLHSFSTKFMCNVSIVAH